MNIFLLYNSSLVMMAIQTYQIETEKYFYLLEEFLTH